MFIKHFFASLSAKHLTYSTSQLFMLVLWGSEYDRPQLIVEKWGTERESHLLEVAHGGKGETGRVLATWRAPSPKSFVGIFKLLLSILCVPGTDLTAS